MVRCARRPGRISPKMLKRTGASRRSMTKRTGHPRVQFINRQRLAIAHDSPLKEALLILDDCFETPTQLDNDMIRILFKHGRHLQAAVWVVQQYIDREPHDCHPPPKK